MELAATAQRSSNIHKIVIFDDSFVPKILDVATITMVTFNTYLKAQLFISAGISGGRGEVSLF